MMSTKLKPNTEINDFKNAVEIEYAKRIVDSIYDLVDESES
jgi:hypothetical protein